MIPMSKRLLDFGAHGFCRAKTRLQWEATLRRIIPIFLALICIIWATTPSAFSQATTGSILGAVADGSNAMIVGAEVTATNRATGIKQSAMTDSGGNYRLAQLVPGTYIVSVNMPGFKSLSESVDLVVDQQINLNLTLTVGAAGESVTVTAAT